MKSVIVRWTTGVAVAGAVAGCAGNEPVAKSPPPKPKPAVVQARTVPPPPRPQPPPPLPSAPPTATPTPARGGAVLGVASPDGGSDLAGDARAAYDRGFQAWVAGDLRNAKAALTEAAAKAPTSAGARYSLGCVLERLGDMQGALNAYRVAASQSSRYEVAAGAYALLLARTGHGAEGEQFLGERRAKNPGSALLITYEAEVKSIEGDSPGCQRLAQEALQKQPDSKDAMVVIARDYYRNHHWDLARYALQAILEGSEDGSIPARDPGNPEALLLRGLVEREMGDRKQAISDFERASAKRPDMFEAHVNLGEMKLEAGNAAEAQAPLERAVAFAPNAGVAHLDLGDCYRLLGRPADAKRELDAALGLDSTLSGAHYDLGLLYLFSPAVPGVSSPDDQLTHAIREFESYRSMRGAKAPKGQGDDVEELLSTAKRKQSELQMKSQAAQPAGPTAAPASGVAAPATAPAPATPPAPSAAPAPARAPASVAPPAKSPRVRKK
ncbi:MAG: tetratricopeptide repeat protein [Polyangiaceae bacterium]|nr:tetratricopeptide repeat protein [Polyangiaceae bacterium]